MTTLLEGQTRGLYAWVNPNASLEARVRARFASDLEADYYAKVDDYYVDEGRAGAPDDLEFSWTVACGRCGQVHPC